MIVLIGNTGKSKDFDTLDHKELHQKNKHMILVEEMLEFLNIHRLDCRIVLVNNMQKYFQLSKVLHHHCSKLQNQCFHPFHWCIFVLIGSIDKFQDFGMLDHIVPFQNCKILVEEMLEFLNIHRLDCKIVLVSNMQKYFQLSKLHIPNYSKLHIQK